MRYEELKQRKEDLHEKVKRSKKAINRMMALSEIKEEERSKGIVSNEFIQSIRTKYRIDC